MSRKPDKAPRKPAATSFDVARVAGVSRAVVSRAFTPGSSISAEAREKVLKAASQLDYRVNHMARALNKQRSDLVGVIASGLSNPYHAAQVDALAKRLVDEGFRPMLFCIDDTRDAEQLISMLLNYAVSGVVVTSDLPPEKICRECANLNTPLVIIDRGHHYAHVDQVTGDNAAGGRLAAEALLAEGRREFFTLEPKVRVYSIATRMAAFCEHLSSRGLEPVRIDVDNVDYQSGLAAAKVVSGLDFRGAGVFGPNDLCALGFVDAMRNTAGADIPDDLSVIGYDNIEQSAWKFADLTTIDQPIQQIAEITTDLLLSRIETPEAEENRVILPVRLVKRGTTR